MIIKPKVRGNGGKLADYLLADKKNDSAELVEMRGFHRPTLKGALQMEEEIALTNTHCKNPFYHVSFRAAEGENLTREQWQRCADRLEQELGLAGHSRALVIHTHKGQEHLHAVYLRTDERTMRAVHLHQDWPRCQKVARELERELGLTRVRDKAPERELAPPTFREEQQERRQERKNLNETREAIREAWEQSDNGRSFAAALKERDLTLARGDRRDFVALDEDGSVYTIGKRTTGARAAEVRERLADLDREDMPTVDQVREQQRAERGREREQAQEREQLEESRKQEGREGKRAAPKMDRTERFLKRQDELKDKLLERQEAQRNKLEKWMQQRDEKLEAWFKAKADKLEGQAVAKQLTRLAEREDARRALKEKWDSERVERKQESLARSLEKIKAIRREENVRRVEAQEARHADQRAQLAIKQAEIRQRYGIQAPERDEAAQQLAAELKQRAFKRAERETDGITLKATKDKINRAAEEARKARAQEWKEQREREAAARKEARREEWVEERQEERQKKHDARRAAKLGATLYDRADMVSMQHDAMRDLRERGRTRRRGDHEEPRHPDPQEQSEAEARDQEQREAERQDQQRPEARAERHDAAREITDLRRIITDPQYRQERQDAAAERRRQQEQEREAKRREDQEQREAERQDQQGPEARAERQDAAREITDLRRIITDKQYQQERQDAYAERRRQQAQEREQGEEGRSRERER